MKTAAVGTFVSDFELPDQHGTPRRLSQLLTDGPVVLFFYPGAMSPGCTVEACSFREVGAEFAELGAQRVGISRDAVDKQQRFATGSALDYPLLSDADGTVATALGVSRRFLPPVKRVTFVIDQDLRIATVIASEFSMTAHAQQTLDFLRRRARPKSA